jgi:UDP-N-acetylglucosamine 4,6-dehydratase
MTRFWITLDHGVELVWKAFEVMHGGETFVPKIPSMNVVDLAEVVAPGCQHKLVGVRPGEKLHEVMVPADEARNTVETDDMYVILPAFKAWDGDDSWSAYPKVPDGFCYSSDSNPWRLSREELMRMVDRS